MKLKLIAGLLASLPLLASAQSSVTIYGIADGSIAREDTGATNGSRTIIASGNQSTSRIGFRGVEDIGNGLKGIFNLEAGYNIDSGAGDSVLFGRRAVVGLQGGFGTVTVGREYTPIADVANASDINGQGFYGTNLVSFGGANRLTRRISNSVNYRSNSMGGLKFGAAYGLGETATGPSQDLMGFSAEYANGPVYLGGGYHQVERLASEDDKEYIFGAGFKIGSNFELKGNYMVSDYANATRLPGVGISTKYEQLNAGASFAMGASKFFANVSQSKLEGNGAKANGLSLAYSYALSKRTNLYAVAAKVRNNNKATFALASAGSTVAPPVTALGADPSAYTIGVRHQF